MANTLTTISTTMLQDEVLPALKLGLSPLNAMSLLILDVPKNVGDSVLVPVVSSKTAGTYSTTYETGNSTMVGTSVAMAAPTFSSWFVNPHLEGAATAERFLAHGAEAAYAVAKAIVQDVLAFFVTANIGAGAGDLNVVAAANYDVDDQADLWSLIKTKGVNGGISAIHNIAYASNLLKDAALQDRSASGSSMLMTGELPPVLGAAQYYTDAFPTALTNENVGVVYTGKTTAAVAIGVPAGIDEASQSAAGVREQIITDPDSGISMIWRTWVNSATGEQWGAVYAMHGQSFIQDAAVRITSA